MTSYLAEILIRKLACAWGLAVLLSLLAGAASVAQEQSKNVPGIKVPEGFEVTQVADDQLVTNIYSLAVSPKGQTFVTGPGYIKVLIDLDGDRVFESAKTFSNQPRSGAQGICFDGDDLLCTGDGALLKFTDANQDGVSDGAPQRIFSIKTGGEHEAHSVRKGPDGWWYVLAGNAVPILNEYYSSPNSPVKNPRAGFLMRISPDWSEKQIYCHGFRNAYDFDFNSIGEMFVFDSDGERDVSLPWYRPTRIFRMRPGDDAGFVAPGWKRPSHFYDMPPEVGALGRGSPTGVVVGQSKSFPRKYDDAIFVADWTFGRITVFKRDRDGRYDRGSDFAVANGQFGFAVTDLDFAKDGSLLISVGGRGTQGGVYRVSYVGSRDVETEVEDSKAWAETKQFISKAKSQSASAKEVVAALKSSDPRRRECAIEALLIDSKRWSLYEPELAEAITAAAKDFEPRQQVLLSRLMTLLTTESQKKIMTNDLARGLFRCLNDPNQVDYETLRFVVDRLVDPKGYKSWLPRLGQLAVGGCGASGEQPMFVGYSARNKVKLSDSVRQRYSRVLAEALEASSDNGVREEIGRLAAMLGVGSKKLRGAVSRQLLITDATVQQDIHWLNCYSQSSKRLDRGEQGSVAQPDFPAIVDRRVANALVGIGGKIKRDNLNLDRNFYPHLKTLATSLFENSSPNLAERVAARITGAESDVFLLESVPRSATKARETAIQKFAVAIAESPESATAAQVSVLVNDLSVLVNDEPSGKHLPLIRSLAERSELLQGLAIKAVLKAPIVSDRKLLTAGLESAELSTVKNAAIGLRRIFDKPRPQELATAISVASRLGWDNPSVSVRDQLMMLVAIHEHVAFGEIGYQFKKQKLDQSEEMARWEKWILANHPVEYQAAFDRKDSVDWTKVKDRIVSIAWDQGNADRGSELYKSLQCAACHDGGSRMGPSLEGIAKRFSRDDIFKAILLPNQQVPQRYRALVIETVDGKLFRGSQVYESADGITLQQINGTTVRINQQDIEARVLSAKSLMPEGLLKDSSDQDWSDLYKYLMAK